MDPKWGDVGRRGGCLILGPWKKHEENSKLLDQMRIHRLYREYPWPGVDHLGVDKGTFGNLVVYCGMAYDKQGETTALCNDGVENSLLVWSNKSLAELKKRGGDLKKME